MSADAWDMCPVCKDESDDVHDGTVREYYEFYLNDDGTATFEVSAECQTCGAVWEFEIHNIKHKMGVSVQ